MEARASWPRAQGHTEVTQGAHSQSGPRQGVRLQTPQRLMLTLLPAAKLDPCPECWRVSIALESQRTHEQGASFELRCGKVHHALPTTDEMLVGSGSSLLSDAPLQQPVPGKAAKVQEGGNAAPGTAGKNGGLCLTCSTK